MIKEFLEELFDVEVIALLRRTEGGFERIFADVNFKLESGVEDWFLEEDRDRVLELDNVYVKSGDYLLVLPEMSPKAEDEMLKYAKFVIENFLQQIRLDSYRERLRFVVALANRLVRIFTVDMLVEEVGNLFLKHFSGVTVVFYVDDSVYAFSDASKAGVLLFLKKVEEEFKAIVRSTGLLQDVDFSKASIKVKSGDGILPDYTTGFVFPVITKSKRFMLVGIYGLKHDYSFFFRLIANYLFLTFERAVLFEKVFEASVKDGLTGLYNRAFFNQMLEKEVERARRYQLPISVVMLDIDHFKSVNDTYGHQVGDRILKEVARIVMENSRSSDLAARYGGEEIVVIMPQTSDGSKIWAERVRERIKMETENPKVTASFGVCIGDYSYGDWTGEELVKAADEALYRAKENGRNRVEVVDLRGSRRLKEKVEGKG